MDHKVNIPVEQEFSVNIENVNFRLLVSKLSSDEKEASPFMLHNHVSAELFAAVEGEIKIATEDDAVVLAAGDIAVVPPGVKHAMLPRKYGSEAAVISFICNKRGDRGTVNLYDKLRRYVDDRKITVKRGVPELCKTVKAMSSNWNVPSDIIPAVKAVTLLVELSNFDDGIVENSDIKKSEKYDIHRMMQLDNIIGKYYTNNLSISEVAAKLYISVRQLDRIVRKRYGKTFHKVIMEKRVQAAEKLLLTTNMTVENIGRTVGFGSNPGFYREFFALFGVTPAEYRKKQKLLTEKTVDKYNNICKST